MRQEFAGHLGVAMRVETCLSDCQDLLDQLVPCFRDRRDVGPALNAELLEILLPRPTFRRLDADFANLDEMSIIDQPLDEVAHCARGALMMVMSSTSRSARCFAVARTPMSAPASVGRRGIRNESPASRRARRPWLCSSGSMRS